MRILIFCLAFFCLHDLSACSTFFFESNGKMIFGRNYDWNIGNGHVFENRSGLRKQSWVIPPEKPVSWVSKYGSITFNQFGKEFPLGGMNESGLVVEVMWLNETVWPSPDGRPAMNELQWVQYQLDNHATVAEVIASDRNIRIGQTSSNIHYLVADAEGNAATIEFLNGELVVHTGADLESKVLTNNTYDASLRYLKQHRGFGGDREVNYGDGSLDRFVQASGMVNLARVLDGSPVDYAFGILHQVAQGATQWTIVYDMTSKKIYYKTAQNEIIQSVSLSDFAFDCKGHGRMAGIHEVKGDKKSQFRPYSAEENLQNIRLTFAKIDFLRNFPDAVLEQLAHYPESLNCD